MSFIVAVLETMWGDREGRAPRYFKINPHNKSGKRLYKFVGPENAHRLVVTNCCRELVTSANHHGKPDAKWLHENLTRLNPSIILVCGAVARKTFRESGYALSDKNIDFEYFSSLDVDGRTVFWLLHPAARTWTKKQLRETERRIQKATR